MSEKRRAFVEFILERERTGRNGKPYTSWNVKLQDADTGAVDDTWYQFGFDQPEHNGTKLDVGQYIQIEYDVHGDARRVVKGSLKISTAKSAADKPTNPDAKPEASKGGGSSGGGDKWGPKQSELFGTFGGNYTEDDIKRITFQSALDKAMRTVEVLNDLNGLKVSEAQGAAGVTKRYDQVLGIIDKLATKYYFDIATMRVIDDNEDEGTVSAKSDPLPDAEPSQDELLDDDGFPEDEPDDFE
jgi:hypothetical protein